MDLPSGGHRVSIVLEVRKFKCRNEDCIRKIFSERYPDYTKPYSRKTDRAVENLASILIEVSSRKGSYLTGLIQMKQSPSTCLRIVSRLPIPGYTDKKVIGIDDWTFRKGINYGSIIVDAETGRPIDLINSRGELEVTSWLKNHPEIDIVTRDRASSYSKAIRTALPSCIQIADKFHIVKNLSGRVNEVVRKQYTSIKAEFIESLNNSNNCSGQDILENPTGILMKTNIPVNENEIPSELANKEASDTSLNIKGSTHYREELYNKIHELHDAGISIRKIAVILQVHRETVRHYLRHETFPKKRIVFTNNYEAYLDVITFECGQGKNIKEIYSRLRQEGFQGKTSAFYSWFGRNYPDYNCKHKEARKEMIEKRSPSILFNSLSPGKMSIYISNPTWGISKTGKPCKEHSLMQQIIQRSPLLQHLREIMSSFKNLLKSRMPELLTEWMDKAMSYKISDVSSFVNGLKAELDAVENAISYPWTNGFIEGNVNRLKTKKREMYGRAGFELLRRKVVLSKMG